jgi:type 2 lantibiotic biosynthesis protein LanM
VAERRLAAWRAQPPFGDDALFTRRLAADGLDPQRFRALLGESPDSLVRRAGPPPWLAELEAAYGGVSSPSAGLPETLPPPPARDDLTTLLDPLVRRAHARLAARAHEVLQGPSPPVGWRCVPGLFAEGLEAALGPLIARTLVLELHVARLREELAGETPEARYRSFVGRLRRPEVAAALLDEYPVLARLAVETAGDWVEAGAEVVERLAADLPLLIRELWDGEAPGSLTAVSGGLGDRHRSGRSVMKLTFESGRRVVYKPRSMTVDAQFQGLLSRLDEIGDPPPLGVVRVLDRGTYGWMEHVSPAPCTHRDGLERFHRRLGVYLALLWTLDAVDLHFENLIAAGERPVLVDLETLFHPRPPQPRPAESSPVRADQRLAGRALDRSLIRVGLLPFPLAGPDGGPGLDLSGLAAVAGESPDPALQLRGDGTDTMHVVRETVTLEPGENRPKLADGAEAGGDLDALAFADDLLGGFRQGWELLRRHRDELTERLEAFARVPVRAVLRPTRAYGLLEQDGLHPDLLRDALDRDRYFGHLWYGLDERPHLFEVVAEEHRQLVRCDVPYFTARPDATSVWVDEGAGPGATGEIPGISVRPPLEEARERLASLSPEERRFQSWILETSLAPLALERREVPWVRYELPEPPSGARAAGPDPEAVRDRLRAVAARAGERLKELALAGDGHLTWVGLEPRREGYGLGPLGDDLYGGVPGVATFLAYLAAVSGERRWDDLARTAIRTLRAGLGSTRDERRLIGAFEGWGGLAWVFTHLAALWDDGDCDRVALDCLRRGAAALPGDAELDVVSGAAGLLAASLAHHRTTGRDEALGVAVACGEHLLTAARPEPGAALSWVRRGSGIEPHTGFSHGAAGFGWVLGLLAGVTGEERFRDAARRAFRYEARRFRPDLGNWIDSDDPSHGASGAAAGRIDRVTSMAWCYGAPGIGLARLGYLRAVPYGGDADDEIRAELRQALATTRRRGFGFNHCLCHGDLGNAELLLQAGEVDEVMRRGRQIAASILGAEAGSEPGEVPGILCGTPTGVEAPGLMHGLAGVGWGALRLAEPWRVPSVLTLDPPPGTGGSRAGISSSER